MSATKNCPNCGAEAPVSAVRCKDCFADLTARRTPRIGVGLLVTLGLITAMAFILAIVLGVIVSWPTDRHVLIEDESDSILVVTKYRYTTSTDRIPFTQVSALQHIVNSDGSYQIVVLETDGDELELVRERHNLHDDTERYAGIMNKPWTEVDHTSGRAN